MREESYSKRRELNIEIRENQKEKKTIEKQAN